jgi:hypothetical protein
MFRKVATTTLTIEDYTDPDAEAAEPEVEAGSKAGRGPSFDEVLAKLRIENHKPELVAQDIITVRQKHCDAWHCHSCQYAA